MWDLKLPVGYHVLRDNNLTTLRRADGSLVAAFSTQGADPRKIEQAAREDAGKRGCD